MQRVAAAGQRERISEKRHVLDTSDGAAAAAAAVADLRSDTGSCFCFSRNAWSCSGVIRRSMPSTDLRTL